MKHKIGDTIKLLEVKKVGKLEIYVKEVKRAGKKWREYSFAANNCEDCPMGWEDRGYEGECNDCGCLFDHDFRVPLWKCLLPDWVLARIAKRIKRRWEDYG